MNNTERNGDLGECLSTYALERSRFVQGALREREHLARCPDCRKRVEALAVSDIDFATEVFPKTCPVVTARALQDLHGRRFSSVFSALRRPSALAGIGLAAAATVLLLVGGPYLKTDKSTSSPPAVVDATYLGDKGGVGLEVYCKRGGKVFRAHEGAILFVDDMLRFVPRVPAKGAQYLMIVSVDSLGTVSRYFPTDSKQAAETPGVNEPLPGSVILDDTPGPERIWLLAAEEPFDFEAVKRAAAGEWQRQGTPAKMGRLPLPAAQVGILFFKKGAP